MSCQIIRSGDINCHGEHSIEIPIDIVPMDLGEGRNMLTITELNIEKYGKLSSKFHYVYFNRKLKV